MKWIFKCGRCGEYPVDRPTLEAFITPELREALKNKIDVPDSKFVRAVLDFGKQCQMCQPGKEHQVHLAVFEEK